MNIFTGEKAKKAFSVAAAHIRYMLSAHGFKRLFIAWLCVSAMCIAFIGPPFTNMGFFGQIKLPMLIASVMLIWLTLSLIKSERIMSPMLILSACFLAATAALESAATSFLIGLCAAVGLVIMFTDIGDIRLGRLSKPTVKWTAALALALAMAVTVGILCCLHYSNHWTSCFDFGIFSQVFYYLKETGLPLATCERDGLLSHFAVHVSPVFYLLLPIYAIFPFPEALLISQAVVIASGVVPLLLICKRLSLGNTESLLLAVCYLAYPSFIGGAFYYFHENCFLAPLIMWLIYFCECENTPLSLVFTLLLLSVKEDAAVYAAVIALYFLFAAKSKKSRITNACILLISVLYFIIITRILSEYGTGAMTWRYSNYMYDGSHSLVTVFKAIAADPVYVIAQCFTQDKLMFMLQMLLPLGFLPLMLRSPKGLIMLIPFVLINLMTSYGYQFNINYQYTFGSGAALIYISAVNYSQLKEKTKSAKKIILTAAACAVIMLIGTHSQRLDYFVQYERNKAQREAVNYALTYVPENASVCASTFLVPDLSQRDEVYQLEVTKRTAEYYVLDLRYTSDEFSVSDYQAPRYETVYIEDGIIAIFKDTEYSK